MTWFLPFITIINHQNKNVDEPTLWQLEVKCGSDYSGFNKSQEHMLFHGLLDHVKDHFIINILFI
jgi:hypothetical protein